MQKFKNLTAVLLAVAVIFTSAFTVFACITQNTGGGYNGLCDISASSKEWILENFGDCPDTESLLLRMSDFAVENFTYELQTYLIFQVADFDSFIASKNFYGMCFEFAVFAKTVALVWAEERGEELKAHICNTYYYDKQGEKQAHSYNFFAVGERCYYLDLTGDVSDAKNGRKPTGPLICRRPKEVVNQAIYAPYRSEFI